MTLCYISLANSAVATCSNRKYSTVIRNNDFYLSWL